ncbi:MAG: Crp/Fnr family transcriptional regulator [Alphaproteobacteria bacterium]
MAANRVHRRDRQVRLDATLLQKVRYFQSLTPAELETIVPRVCNKWYERGELIIVEGQVAHGLYFVVSGRVKAFRMSPNGRMREFLVMGPGDTFNDVAAIDSGATTAHMEAMEPTLVGIVSQEQLKAILAQYPAVAFASLQQFARRLRNVVDIASEESLKSVKGRLATLLLHSFDGLPAPCGIQSKSLKLAQKDIAARVGTTREVIARRLKDLEVAGAVKRRRTSVMLVDRDILAAIAVAAESR